MLAIGLMSAPFRADFRLLNLLLQTPRKGFARAFENGSQPVDASVVVDKVQD